MRSRYICSVLFLLLFLAGCLEDYCDPDKDQSYCDGNVAMTCGSNPEGAGHIWSRGECDKDVGQPYCIVGEPVINGKKTKSAHCSSIPTVKEECYEKGSSALKFCIDGKVAVCSDIGGAVLIKDENC